jgi:hypothetical protein
MLENQKIRPAQVIGPLGEPLTLDSLPPAHTTRWVVRRKAEVVAAVAGGFSASTKRASATRSASRNSPAGSARSTAAACRPARHPLKQYRDSTSASRRYLTRKSLRRPIYPALQPSSGLEYAGNSTHFSETETTHAHRAFLDAGKAACLVAAS